MFLVMDQKIQAKGLFYSGFLMRQLKQEKEKTDSKEFAPLGCLAFVMKA